MSFVKLHANGTGNPVYVNVHVAEVVEPVGEGGSRICMPSDNSVHVTESAEIVIKEATNSAPVRNCEKFKTFDVALKAFLEEFFLISEPDITNSDRWDRLPESAKNAFARWLYSTRVRKLNLNEKGEPADLREFAIK